MKGERQLVGADFRGGVGGLAAQRMLLRDRYETRGSVDFACRCVHDLRDTKLARRLEHVERALYIGLDIRIWRVVRIWYCNQGGEVEHDVAAAHRFPNAVGIPNVARENIQVRS